MYWWEVLILIFSTLLIPATIAAAAFWQAHIYNDSNNKSILIGLRQSKYEDFRNLYKRLIKEFNTVHVFHNAHDVVLFRGYKKKENDEILLWAAERSYGFECKITDIICIINDINTDRFFYSGKYELLRNLNKTMAHLIEIRDYFHDVLQFINDDYSSDTIKILQDKYADFNGKVTESFRSFMLEVENHIEEMIKDKCKQIKKDFLDRKDKHDFMIDELLKEEWERINKIKKDKNHLL